MYYEVIKMNYSISQVSKIANVSKRAIRYYDQIGILSPNHINDSGYRVYTTKEIDILQQIMFFKEFDVPLTEIKSILNDPNYNRLLELNKHRNALIEKQNRINTLLKNLDQTITSIERSTIMKDSEKFQGFKEQLISNNEKLYGDEIKQKYGETQIQDSYEKVRKMTKKEYLYAEELGKKILNQLIVAVKTGNTNSNEAISLAKMHQEWIKIYWKEYSIEAHKSLVQMYVTDDRFAAYYNNVVANGAIFIRDAVLANLS